VALEIHAIPVGPDNVYAIKDEGTILVDGGVPGRSALLLPGLRAASVSPGDVRLIVLTHGHWDHIGCAAALKELTGAPLAMHHTERERVEKPLKAMPPGVTWWGKVFGTFCTVAFVPFIRITPATVDIAVSDEGMSLEPYGVRGRVLHTPGHSPGSLTILLESGDALVGDLAMNQFPLRIGPGLPIFAEDLPRLKASIEQVLALGATTIHPAHGRAFPAAVLRQAVATL
jgi:hydroxyacylglutathione hydrolase